MFNFTAAFVMAGYVIKVLINNTSFNDSLREEDIKFASSHRIGTLVGMTSSWRVMATQVEVPDYGICLRWRKRTGVQAASYLWIHAEADPDPARGFPGDQVIIEKVPMERADLLADNAIIVEFFFPASGSKGFPQGGYEATGNKDLMCQYRYRFKVMGYNENEDLVGESEWSNEVYVRPRSTVFDVPCRILKAYFPVPTNSMEYFVEHFAEFNIYGKHPQHLVVLSDLKICYHKNWKDFSKDMNMTYSLEAMMGESRAKCEKDTKSGLCQSFAKTDLFRPPETVLDEDVDEEDRIQMLDTAVGSRQVLRVGAADRQLQDVIISLRRGTGDDVAEGKLEWDDLMEVFEQSEDQLIFVDLKMEKEDGLDFNEDWLVWVEARVTFESNLDRQCEEKPFKDRLFLSDAPGQIFFSGMERFVNWESENDLLSEVDKFDIYMTYPNGELPPNLLKEGAQTSHGGVSTLVVFPEELNANYVVGQLRIAAPGKYDLDNQCVTSHRFIVCRTWTLSEFEIMYAAFCKMNNMEMERLTMEELSDFGMKVAYEQLKIASGLRKSLPFEDIGDHQIIDTEGTYMISDSVIQAKKFDNAEGGTFRGDRSESGSISKTISASGSPLLAGGSKTGSTERSKISQEKPREYRPTFQSAGFLQNAWPARRSFANWEYGTGWYPNFLLQNAFYPVDNIISGMGYIADSLQLRAVFFSLAGVFGRHAADNALGFIKAPLYRFVPYFCEAFLYFLQATTFMLLPLILLAFGLCYEFVGTLFGRNPESFHPGLKAHMPDAMFSAVVSGNSYTDYLGKLSLVSKVSLWGSVISAALLLFLIMESNFFRNVAPSRVQHTLHEIINSFGSTVIYFMTWSFLSFVISCLLWFGMVVVIYPEQMLTALACVGGVTAIFVTMITGLKNTKEEIDLALREEIPEVLELVCDSFLDAYDKTASGTNKQMESQHKKLATALQERIYRYAVERLKGKEALKAIFERCQNSAEGQHDGKPSQDAVAEAMNSIFSRALIKERNWPAIDAQERDERDGKSEGKPPAETTETILESLGLPQEDTSVMNYLDLRMRLEDKEKETGGESVHLYGPDLQQKLMKVFVRMQARHMVMPKDIEDATRNVKRFATAMEKASLAKLRALEHSGTESLSFLQLFIQELNFEKSKAAFKYMAEHLDVTLDPADISEKVTPFVENTMPKEIRKQIRFALDEHRPFSPAQKVFEQLRLKKSGLSAARLRERLTFYAASVRGKGLMQFLVDIGLVDKDASRVAMNYTAIYNTVERAVRDWRDDEEEGDEMHVNESDIEGFVRELIGDRIWWGAMEKILERIGFPMTRDSRDKTPGYLSKELVKEEYERAAAKDGFLPKDKVLDFLRKITGADVADGASGRIWKAQMVMLLEHLQICGSVGVPKALKATAMRLKKGVDNENQRLVELAGYKWPQWLENEWDKIAPTYAEGLDIKPFLPRTLIYKFVKSLAFDREKSQRSKEDREETDKYKVVDEEYDNWKVQNDDGIKHIWNLRGQSALHLRGIWHECFLDILDRMGSPVDPMEGVELFQKALKRQQQDKGQDPTSVDAELVSVDWFEKTWLPENVENNTKEVSLAIFREALEKAEFTLPKSSIEALWYSADKSVCSHSSLRRVTDLEDRLVMYLSTGLTFEAVRNLIFNELQVPSLQELKLKEIQAAFTQVDEKTGCCGVIDPHEVSELFLLLSQEGMTLSVVQTSFESLKLNIHEDTVHDAFIMVDTNCDDKIDMTEFLALFDTLVEDLLPDEIFRLMGLQMQQIWVNVLGKIATILTMFLFIFVSLNAFHVDVSKEAAGAGSSIIRAALAGLALLGLRNDNSPEYLERQYNMAKEHLYRLTGVTRSQLEARRRTGTLGAGAAMAGKSRLMMQRRGGGGGFGMKEEEGDDDDGGGDD
eukprot:TRINITY_DN21397_c0_g2_i2.p1 TRINITY_DN21397_c0_g2~~TRINITY_DN21397_c0_g2_i2.p1  ORF type:complete len:2222 (-),score=565.91 TRINITY_DN21397_c0_g2_i2:72-5774(-)